MQIYSGVRPASFWVYTKSRRARFSVRGVRYYNCPMTALTLEAFPWQVLLSHQIGLTASPSLSDPSIHSPLFLFLLLFSSRTLTNNNSRFSG